MSRRRTGRVRGEGDVPGVRPGWDNVSVDDRQLGSAIRALRVRRGWRQVDLARRTRLSRQVVGRIERGDAGSLPVNVLRRASDALGARFDTIIRWQGSDLVRLLSARHAAIHEAVARQFATIGGWVAEPEVSFSVYGERGIIDILAWHPVARIVVVVELKTGLVDINEMMGTLDRKRRLANGIARGRGFEAVAVGAWLVIADTRTNRRALAAHATVLRAKYPADGRTMRRWLRQPSGGVRALSFLPEGADVGLGRATRPIRRVGRSAVVSRPPE